MDEDKELLIRKLEREIKARNEAEQLLEEKSLELYLLNKSLEEKINIRTSELIAARDQAIKANESKGHFLANMSHEIRTPLHGMLGLLNLMSKTQLNEIQEEYTKTITHSGRMLLTIINEILDFSKIDAGKFEFEYRDFDFRTCIENLIDVLSYDAYAKNLELLLYVDPRIPEILHSDESRLRQVLLNLIGNAIKFTPTGNININITLDDSQSDHKQTYIFFSIKDTGIGIPEDKIKKILLPFSQADTSDLRRYGGTGLGLTISKHIIEQFSGEIKVNSIEAKGTEFQFKIPFNTPYLSKDEPSIKDDLIYITSQKKSVRDNLETIVSSWGYRFESYKNTESIEKKILNTSKLNKHLICDWELFESINNSQSLISDKNLNIILSCAPADKAQLKKKYSKSKINLIAKPFKQGQILTLIENKKIEQNKLKDSFPTQINRKPAQSHILIVEDNQINQTVAAALISQFGYSFDIANNGLEAVNMFKEKSYTLILMDCQMPTMDGYTATKEIRMIESNLNIKTATPIIAMTANAFRKTKEKCFECGMNSFLSKPFSPSELEEVLINHTKQIQKTG